MLDNVETLTFETEEGTIKGGAAEDLLTHFNEARDALVFMLDSSREQARRVGLLGDIINVCRTDYGIDCGMEFAYTIAHGIKDTYTDMIERVKKLQLEDFLVPAQDVKDPFEDMLCFWDEKDYTGLTEIIYDTFIYDTIKPMGGKLTQLWQATREECDRILKNTGEQQGGKDDAEETDENKDTV